MRGSSLAPKRRLAIAGRTALQRVIPANSLERMPPPTRRGMTTMDEFATEIRDKQGPSRASANRSVRRGARTRSPLNSQPHFAYATWSQGSGASWPSSGRSWRSFFSEPDPARAPRPDQPSAGPLGITRGNHDRPMATVRPAMPIWYQPFMPPLGRRRMTRTSAGGPPPAGRSRRKCRFGFHSGTSTFALLDLRAVLVRGQRHRAAHRVPPRPPVVTAGLNAFNSLFHMDTGIQRRLLVLELCPPPVFPPRRRHRRRGHNGTGCPDIDTSRRCRSCSS